MEDFDMFTNEINFSMPLFKNILTKYVKDFPQTPNGPNYQSSRKLYAEELLADNDEIGCAFQMSEAVASSLRTMAVYRDDQMRASENKLHSVTKFLKPVNELIGSNTISKNDQTFLDIVSSDMKDVDQMLKSFHIEKDLPFHKRYLRFSDENNVDNFKKILDELPKEWTIIQLTAPYNPNENIKPHSEYRTEVNSVYFSIFTNDYLEYCGLGPITVNIPANINKEGEKPLFTELYSLLDENYKTIDNAQFLSNKKLVQNYWNKREDIDLRLKSVINDMNKEWLGGFGCLLTGRLIDGNQKDKVIKLVDTTISDWGFIRLTQKQKFLLYNLIECCPVLASQQIKSCIRRILTEHGNPEDVRKVLTCCENCSRDFRFLNELCLKCLSTGFEAVHNFTLVDGIRAFSQTATLVKDGDEWAELKKAKRYPVILIVDEVLDTFPWESIPVLNHHPVSRMENIHFLYYLYKIHEKDIADGYFMAKTDVGRYVINPGEGLYELLTLLDRNLDRMENRMKSFVEYWCGSWSGHAGEAPQPGRFLEHLMEADVFLYCGHGDGCHFANGGANGAGVEGASGSKALVILSGCGSVRLTSPPGRAPPAASHHHLHIAGCPTVVGMLWEVTDMEVDKLVSSLVSLFVPSDAKVPWTSVGKAKWSQGQLETEVEQKRPFTPEPDILRAVAKSRAFSVYAMIASSVVARGLPLRIADVKR